MNAREKDIIISKIMEASDKQGYFYTIKDAPHMEQTAHDQCIWDCAIMTALETICKEVGIEVDADEEQRRFRAGVERAERDIAAHKFGKLLSQRFSWGSS